MVESSPTPPAVAWNPALGGWAVSSYDLVREVLRDTARFTSEGTAIAENLGTEAILVNDSPVHDVIRRLWSAPFSAATAASRRAELESLADRLLVPVLGKLRAGEVVDLVPVFETFASRVVLGMLNLASASEEDFQRWYKVILDSAAFTITPSHSLYEERTRAKAQIYAILEAEVEDRLHRLAKGENPADLPSLIVREEGKSGITRSVTLDNLFNVFIGGADTTVRWMGNAVVVLHRHPEVLAILRDKPVMLPRALEEVLRLESVTRFAIRKVRADDVELGGQALARGDIVYALTSVANRDPAAFEEPDRFNIFREAKPHLGFSHGMHKCIGMNLARVEAQSLIGRLLSEDIDLEIVEVDYSDDSVVRGPQRLLLRAPGSRT